MFVNSYERSRIYLCSQTVDYDAVHEYTRSTGTVTKRMILLKVH